jgi:hypothetical protein
MRITLFRRHPQGFFQANLTVNGQTVRVDDRSGSWGTVPDEDGRWREILPTYARALAEKRRLAEKHEKDAAKREGAAA